MKAFIKWLQSLSRQNNDAQPEDEDYIADSKAALLGKPTFFASSILYVLILFLVAFLIWSYFAKIDQSTVGSGRVIPITQNQVIQSVEGGVITKIYVKEGRIVQSGQIVASLDTTRFVSEYDANYEKYLSLAAAVARLTAEAANSNHIDFPSFIQKEKPELIKIETALFDIEQQTLKNELSNLQNQLDSANKEVKMFQSLLAGQYVSELQYLHAYREAKEIQRQLMENKNKIRENVLTQLNQSKQELASLKDVLMELKDKINRETLRSPVYGMVKKVYVTTVGGVVNPGMVIMEIVPLGDTLLVEAHINPRDIAFIHIGQPASIKITAYDYTIYGSLTGKVVYISPDVITEARSVVPASIPENYYLIFVRTNRTYFGTQKHKLPIIPGMAAIVQIKTGKNTVLNYLLKPLLKTREEAMQER